MATAGILTERNNASHSLLGGRKRTPSSVKKLTKSLKKWWGIENRQDFIDTLQWIHDGGHRKEFMEINDKISEIPSDKLSAVKMYMERDPEKYNKFIVAINYQNELQNKGIFAWDYSRYVSLCGWGFIVGYITEEEAWTKIMPVAKLLQSTFESWSEFGKNFVAGREFWSWSNTQRNGEKTIKAYKKLLESSASPWVNLPWDLELPGAAYQSTIKEK